MFSSSSKTLLERIPEYLMRIEDFAFDSGQHFRMRLTDRFGCPQNLLHFLVVYCLIAEDAAVELAGLRVDDGVFPSAGHTQILSFGIMIAGVAECSIMPYRRARLTDRASPEADQIARDPRPGSTEVLATIFAVFVLATLKSTADVTQVAQLGRYYLPIFVLALPTAVAGLTEWMDSRRIRRRPVHAQRLRPARGQSRLSRPPATP